jgi:hypothetical protein
MRKLLLAFACLFLATGLAVADVTLVKYDGATKELTVKDGDAEKTYKLTDKTKVTFVDKDGNAKAGTIAAAEKALGNENAKGKLKFELTTDKDQKENVSELKLKMTRKGKN